MSTTEIILWLAERPVLTIGAAALLFIAHFYRATQLELARYTGECEEQYVTVHDVMDARTPLALSDEAKGLVLEGWTVAHRTISPIDDGREVLHSVTLSKLVQRRRGAL